ncbi:archease [Methylacidiphilum kamchatkense]|uniref:Archease family protein n=1 Tax=Methylacidiphilum kamchatkense Kam1 TaxID=1202785 RepID=A0A516TP96_9BACT|nr:archease [Methylacidiphilum kamchatkense]QDQ43067.1 archease family protein [Methylacidiphilum kamchatkense Kam1]
MNIDKQPITSYRWETFSHMADIGIRGFGNSPEEALIAVSLALISVITDPQKVSPTSSVSITCQDDSYDLLLYDWLNSLIFKMATENMLFSAFEVELRLPFLRGMAWGETIDREKHKPAVEVKGATFTELFFGQNGNQWIAQCVVDV